MERVDALVIDVDEGEIVELLQHEVRGIVEDRAALVALQRVEEALEGRSVEHVFAGMDFVGDVDAGLVIRVEDRLPALGELLERRLDQARRALRPWIEIGPRERAGEGRVAVSPMLRRLGRRQQLLDRPFLALGGRLHLGRREGVERLVVGRVDRDELALQMGRQFGDREPVAFRDPGDLVAIGLRVRGLGEIEQPAVPGRDLHALVAERGRPFADRVRMC